MKGVAGLFVATFLLGASASLLANGCGMSTCDCPIPTEPLEQAGYTISEVREYDAHGNSVDPQLKIENGTVAVTRDAVQVEYDHDGVHHVVVYDVVPGAR